MSDVDVDKMASMALSRKRNCSYLIVPIAKHVIENFNRNNLAPICDCVSLPDYCVCCIYGRPYYHCRKSVDDHCCYFKWAD
jgi:hypothetical protein